VWIPDRRQAVAIASNTPDLTAEQLLDAVGPALLAGDPLPPPDRMGDVEAADAAAVAGTYELPTGGAFEVAAADDRRLAVSARGAGAVAALLPVPEEEASADDVRRHEDAVLALLAGETGPGREERAAVEAALGPVDDLTLAGTVVDDGELRTYVSVTSGSSAALVWYSLDDEGGVAAAELATDPPVVRLGSAGDGGDGGDGYRPDDPTGPGPDVTVTFADGVMTVSGPDGDTTARLAA
jgi:hypothetical protein